MKLLFDENLSARLAALVADRHPGSLHVEQALGRRSTDEAIWEFARSSGHVIVSKDNDFRQRAFLYGAPPKVVWLSVGNAGTEQIAELLRSSAAELERFGETEEESLLAIGMTVTGGG